MQDLRAVLVCNNIDLLFNAAKEDEASHMSGEGCVVMTSEPGGNFSLALEALQKQVQN